MARSIDLNVFQHKPYLDDFKARHHVAIIEVFQVPTGPYGLYGGRSERLEDVKEGSIVAGPKDASNFARVLM